MRFSLKQKLAACLLTLSAVIGGGIPGKADPTDQKLLPGCGKGADR